jgi:D-glucosaminate-6-phosphate ammonia-lyase
MVSRRKLLQALSALPFGGALAGSLGLPEVVEAQVVPPFRDFYKELGVRTLINAAGTHTFLTGSLMLPEVVQAINYASTQYVDLNELQDRVGQRLASLLRAEAAMVTAGAASALTLGTAGIITGTDRQKIIDIPNLPGPPLEVIIQRRHRFGYDHAVRNTGIRFVEVETSEELERAVNERTVMMLFMNANNNVGRIRDEEFVALGRKHGIPTFNDCAADVPPMENLWKYNEMGFDLVTFSGGKGLRGPQSSGLLMGRADLIHAARLNAPPNGNTIGRGMKVNKEEILGLMVAVEQYLAMDHAADRAALEARVKHIEREVLRVPGVGTEIVVQEIGNHVPQLRVWWDEARIPMTPAQVRDALRSGHPSIETILLGYLGPGLFVNVWMAPDGQERVVAERLREVLANASTLAGATTTLS